MSKGLKKILKKVFTSDVQEQLAVADSKLGSVIKVGTPDIVSCSLDRHGSFQPQGQAEHQLLTRRCRTGADEVSALADHQPNSGQAIWAVCVLWFC